MSATDALACPRLTPTDRIRLLCEYCQEGKPTHRSEMTVKHPRTGEPVKFLPGKFLNNLTAQLLPGKGKPLEEDTLEMLNELEWFAEWLASLHSQRLVGRNGGRPSIDEEALLVARHFSATPPVRGETRMVARDSGEQYCLNGAAVVERISINWHEESDEAYNERVAAWKAEGGSGAPPRKRAATRFSRIQPTTKLAIEKCSWFRVWHANGKCRRDVAKMRKVVSKDMKLQLLLDHYSCDEWGNAKAKPTTSDCITVRLADNESFRFYPTNFLDDMVDNWVEGGRPGVVLSKYQCNELVEKLPWMRPWLNSVFEIRQRRKRRAEAMDAMEKFQKVVVDEQWSKPQTPQHETDTVSPFWRAQAA